MNSCFTSPLAGEVEAHSPRERGHLHVGIIVGEASGDLLGAALIEKLQKIYPNLTFEGVLGPRLKALGGTALYDSERLAVMGFIEPLKRLPELLRMRRHLIKHYQENPPDVFIGIDAPDFNLGIEKKLKKHGIKTVHYVSPSVWAWRQGRIKKIKQAVDLMLVLFPFEAKFYEQHQVPVVYVGHPMAMQIDLSEAQKTVAIEALSLGERGRGEGGLKRFTPPHPPVGTFSREEKGCSRNCYDKTEGLVLAILPGSRHSEIAHMTELFLKTALLLKAHFPDLRFISPMASPAIREHFLKIKALVAPDLEIQLFDGQADEVLAACDCALITSGTATFQAMLHHCPMVVAYKTSKFNAWLIRKLYKHRYFALPNILFDRRIIPEYFQEAATPDQLFQELKIFLENQSVAEKITDEFLTMHQHLREPAPDVGAQTIKNLLTHVGASDGST